MLAKSMNAEELARELLSVLSTTYGIKSDMLLATTRDRASVNNLAMNAVSIVYPFAVDIGCCAHTLNHMDEKFNTPTLTEFVHNWINLFSHSPKAKLLVTSRLKHGYLLCYTMVEQMGSYQNDHA